MQFSRELDLQLHTGREFNRSVRYSLAGSDALNCSSRYMHRDSDPSSGSPAGERSLAHQRLFAWGQLQGTALRLDQPRKRGRDLIGCLPLDLLPTESIPRGHTQS